MSKYVIYSDKKCKQIIGTVAQAARNLWIWQYGHDFDDRLLYMRRVIKRGRARTMEAVSEQVYSAYKNGRM